MSSKLGGLSRFFVDRPIFAAVLSIVIFTAGAIAIPKLPLSEYPDVVPPSVQVRAIYPGANPQVIADSVAAPIEEAINGVEHMMYMKSVASGDGVLQLNVTFQPGTDPDRAQVQVQNRVQQALPRLPEDVRRQGVTTQKQSPNLTLVVHLTSPNGRYDSVYLRNYALLHVRDELSRIPGVGDALLFGSGDYAMRVWLDPGKVAARGLTATDVVGAIREQNVQVSAGQLGALPLDKPTDFILAINAKGRLVTEDEFGDIVLRTGDNGEITRLRDVARLELGAAAYSLHATLDNQSAVGIGIFQAPGSNVIELSDTIRAKMAELAKGFPPGVSWAVAYDPTVSVRRSIESVIHTLVEAALLVVLVVLLFLRTWRASVIPLIAVPVSIVGTFGVLLLLGFTNNTLTLFGMVLAIGIVVDDAIVVVENVERGIEAGLEPAAAARRAMAEVSAPIIAIALVLCAVFVPMTLMSGLTGQFFRQFAATIAISTIISAINSLTLSPALAAVLLQGHGAKRDRLTWVIETLFGWLFRGFERGFNAFARGYGWLLAVVVRGRIVALVLYAGIVVLAGMSVKAVPVGFVPVQDKMYLIAIARLPEGSSLERTDKVVHQMSEIAMATPGVEHAIAFPGLNAIHFTNTTNAGTVFVTLTPSETRKETAAQLAGQLSMKFAAIGDGLAFALVPPPILGIGTGAGFSLYVEDRNGRGPGELQASIGALTGAIMHEPGFKYPFSAFQPNVPQLELSIDRAKAKQQGIALTDLFATLQIYLGSAYVNDFTRFGHTFQVIAQADGEFRRTEEQIGELRTRNTSGAMVPVGSVVSVSHHFGPDPLVRYNGYPAADLAGEASATLSSGQVIEAIDRLSAGTLPAGFHVEWTDLSYQQVTEGDSNALVFPLAVLLVFLVLAALYESWSLPIAILLIVPVCVVSALGGVWHTGGDRNVFVQIGLVVLVGLASKNAILIVEFARDLESQGRTVVEAAIESARLRLRPIVMTSVAFIAGVIPLILAKGAGAEVRHAMGITVFSGMVGVTVLGLFLTPVFYVTMRRFQSKPPKAIVVVHED
jgi:multidrug efflux pump